MTRKAWSIVAFVLVFSGLVVWEFSGTVKAQGLPCQPYDKAVENLANGGWTVLPDIVLPDGYEVDRLIVGSFEGFAFALPVVDGCVLPVTPLPLGPVKDKGTPA